MRITSELFVAQLVRRVFIDGGFAAVARMGAEAAGAVFVIVRARNGEAALFGPAAQSFAVEDDGARRFMRETAASDEAIASRFEKEARFDPDFWVVEIETETPAAYLSVVAT